jgi:hypothetical protein
MHSSSLPSMLHAPPISSLDLLGSHNCSVSVVIDLRAERRGFDCRQGLGIFLFATTSTPVPGPPSLLSNGYRCFSPSEVKLQGREAQHSLPSTRVYPQVSGLAAWSENCKWYSSLSLCAVVSLLCESI